MKIRKKDKNNNENWNGKLRKLSLKTKIIFLCLLMIFGGVVIFGGSFRIHFSALSNFFSKIGERQKDSIRETSEEFMLDLTQRDLEDVALFYAMDTEQGYSEMTSNLYEISRQVADIIEHPDRYAEVKVYPPLMENAGQYSLQLLNGDRLEKEDDEEAGIVGKVANIAPLLEETLIQRGDESADFYIAFPDGVCLVMDKMPEKKIDENGELLPYEPTERPWYKGALEDDGVCSYTGFHSDFLNRMEVILSCPVIVDGEVVAVISNSGNIEEVDEFLKEAGYGNTGFSVMIDDDGTLVSSPRKDGELSGDKALDINLNESDNEDLQFIAKEAAEGNNGYLELELDGEEYYAAYVPLYYIDWTIVTFISESELEGPTEDLLSDIDDVMDEAVGEYEGMIQTGIAVSGVILVVLVAVTIVIAIAFSGRIVKPIEVMTRRVGGIAGTNFQFEMDDVYRTGDEIEVLAETFGTLSAQIDAYINDIRKITTEKERIGAELSVASTLQEDMLPRNFDLFNDRSDLSVFADMHPAKEVGGDFYDIFFLDENRICMVMGDVSDKGIPAALFMVVTKTMLKNRAQLGGTPSEILYDVNNFLCDGNELLMFVTIWLGVLDLSNGDLTWASAGHEYPMIRQNGGDFEQLNGGNGIVAGLEPDRSFDNVSLRLNRGDSVFIYTDGLTDATAEDGSRFNTQNVLDILNSEKDSSPEKMLSIMKKKVQEFEGAEPQFDDITMMMVTYR